MIKPDYLKTGDKVAIVSTARKIRLPEIEPAIALLESWGVEPVVGKTIGAEYRQFAGDDALRAGDFQNMLDRKDIKAIWCARGGYGTVRIIDALDFSGFKNNPKWVIGFSDITVLHSHLHNIGFESLHGQMPLDITNKSEASKSTLRDALFGKWPEYEFASDERNRLGKASGKIIGGNLSMLYSLAGSPTAIDTKGKILFLEDLDEYLYHVDRMLQNLKRGGYFDQLSALVIGGMSDMKDNEIPFGKTAEEIILDAVSAYEFPVCFGFPAGHIKDNRAMYFGREAVLEVDNVKSFLKYK